jgi:L-alanine-DL-glutamate epimerase-like enolase superfamily enzyme
VNIQSVESFGNASVALVRVRTDDGAEGWEDYPWQAGMYEPRLQVVDGTVSVPTGPGWGVEISPDWLARSEYRVTSAREP